MAERGYVIFKKFTDSIRMRELVAQNGKERLRLIGLVEDMTQKPVVARLGIPYSGGVIHAYKLRGFTVLEKAHGVLIATELVAGASFNDCFGNRFCMSALDLF